VANWQMMHAPVWWECFQLNSVADLVCGDVHGLACVGCSGMHQLMQLVHEALGVLAVVGHWYNEVTQGMQQGDCMASHWDRCLHWIRGQWIGLQWLAGWVVYVLLTPS
jgi:hypothetical protein